MRNGLRSLNVRCSCPIRSSSHISTILHLKHNQEIRFQLSDIYFKLNRTHLKYFDLTCINFRRNLSVSTSWYYGDNPNNDSKKNNKDRKNVGFKDNEKSPATNMIKTGIIARLRLMGDVFWKGCKALFVDVKLAVRTRRKLGLYRAQDYSKLTREELRHLRQTKKDVAKTFPVALLFMIPFIGYSAPVLAYFYPKQLLSQQFWHPDQKKDFILEEYEKRSQYYLPLIKEVGITAKEITNKQLLQFCLTTLDGKHPTNESLLNYQQIFNTHEDLSLQKMPRYHLVKICKCWLIPTAWYLPRWFLISALKKRISRLHQDDVLILRDGIDTLTPECIEQAVHSRGLDEASLCDIAKKHWLDEWIRLSSLVTGDDVSFLAHSAVFKAANFEKVDVVNSPNT